MLDFQRLIDQLKLTLKEASENGEQTPDNDNKPDIKSYYSTLMTVVVVVFLTSALISNLYIVKPNEYKVVRQFGEVVKIVEDPGLNFKLPVVQSITTLPKHLMIYDVTPAEINTFDKKRIMVDHYAVWRVTDPQEMIESLRSVNAAEGRLGDIIYSNIRTELGRLNYDEIINEEKSSRGDINELVRSEVNKILVTNLNGIEVVDLHMKRTDLPVSNEQAVYNRMISERESTAQEYLSQGDAEANIIRAQTDREAEELLAIANAEAKIIIADGDGEAARIYNEAYGQDPEFYSMYRTLESYRVTMQNEPVIIIPIDSPYAKYLLGE